MKWFCRFLWLLGDHNIWFLHLFLLHILAILHWRSFGSVIFHNQRSHLSPNKYYLFMSLWFKIIKSKILVPKRWDISIISTHFLSWLKRNWAWGIYICVIFTRIDTRVTYCIGIVWVTDICWRMCLLLRYPLRNAIL